MREKEGGGRQRAVREKEGGGRQRAVREKVGGGRQRTEGSERESRQRKAEDRGK